MLILKMAQEPAALDELGIGRVLRQDVPRDIDTAEAPQIFHTPAADLQESDH